MASIERQLQLCLNKVEKWADENGIKFSKAKTVCMHFCIKRKLHLDPTLTIYNLHISRLYCSFVCSRLEYGCAVFSSARKSYLEKLENHGQEYA